MCPSVCCGNPYQGLWIQYICHGYGDVVVLLQSVHSPSVGATLVASGGRVVHRISAGGTFFAPYALRLYRATAWLLSFIARGRMQPQQVGTRNGGHKSSTICTSFTFLVEFLHRYTHRRRLGRRWAYVEAPLSCGHGSEQHGTGPAGRFPALVKKRSKSTVNKYTKKCTRSLRGTKY